VKGLYAKGPLEAEARSTHARTCETVSCEPVAKWYMGWEIIKRFKNAAAENS
jgi:hypothetical protein